MILSRPTNTALLNILEGGKGTKEGMTRGIKGGENAKSEKGEAEWGGGLKGKVSKWGNREKEQGRGRGCCLACRAFPLAWVGLWRRTRYMAGQQDSTWKCS